MGWDHALAHVQKLARRLPAVAMAFVWNTLAAPQVDVITCAGPWLYAKPAPHHINNMYSIAIRGSE